MKYYLLFLLLFFTFTAYADRCSVEGTYALSGWESGDNFSKAPSYTGVIELKEYNNVYRFEGSADGMVFFGKGLTNDCKTFAFAFSSGDKSQLGVTLLTKDGVNFNARWSYNFPDTSGAGREVWKRK